MSNLVICPEDDGRDWEAEFYQVMAGIEPDAKAMMLRIRKDTFDASKGPSIGITAAGDVGLMTVMSQPTAMLLMEAWEAYGEHGCESARQALMGFLMQQILLMNMLAPRLDESTKGMTFFEHGPADGG